MPQYTDSTIERNDTAGHPAVMPLVDGLVLLHNESRDITPFGDKFFQTIGKLLGRLMPVRCHQLAVEIIFPVEHGFVDNLPVMPAKLPYLEHLFRC